MNIIRPLQLTDCSSVAILHLENLKTHFSGIPGHNLLRLYYTMIAANSGGCGYTAEENGQMLGYICGIWDPTLIQMELFSQKIISLLFWGSLQAIIMPAMAGSTLARIHRRWSKRNAPSEAREDSYELRPIVVSHHKRGTGVADELVAALIQDARSRGFQQIHLVTEQENLPANRFYTRFGFMKTGEENRSGTLYNRYEISTN